MKLNPQAMGFFSSLIIIGVGLIFSSCDALKGFGIGTSAQYSLVPTEGLTTDAIPQEDFFYVNLSASYYYGEGHDSLDAIIYAMDEGPGTDCKISVNEDSTEDLYCILDVMEGDLFFHKIVLEYNVPPEMCAYSGFLVPYHLNQEVVEGPKHVYSCEFITEIEVNDEGEREVTTETKICADSCSSYDNRGFCDHEGVDVTQRDECSDKDKCEDSQGDCGKIAGYWNPTGGVGGTGGCYDAETGGNAVTITECTASGAACEAISNNCGGGNGKPGVWTPEYVPRIHEDYCKDEVLEICNPHNRSEQGLGNCCLGTYTMHGGSGQSGEWGGDFKECIGGPGRFAWDSYNKGGEPITEVTNTKKDGLKDTYELDAIINVYDGMAESSTDKKIPSFITANHWEDAEDKEFLSSDSKLKAYFTQDPPDPFEQSSNRGEPYFVWTCMDNAQEIKHRIILMVREWNTQKEYNRFKESLGSSGDPDIAGDEGSLCDYYTSDEKTLFERDSLCNDLLDLDDWEANDYGTYPEVIYKDSG